MSKFQKYKAYKEIRSDWIKLIPENWNIFKLKHVLEEKKKKSNPSLPCGSISFAEVVYKDDDAVLPETKASYQEVLSGEFLINPLNLNYDLKSLRTAMSNIDVVVSTGYIVLRKKEEISSIFARWFLYCFDVEQMKGLGSGVRQTINYREIGNEIVFLPPLEEQLKIATFLDKETSKIDTLIEKQKKLIELLKEKRQAVISHAVTKGFDPNVKLKDSGVQWLGEIPEHWNISKIKYCISEPLKYGANEAAVDENINDPRYIRITDFGHDGELKNTSFKSLPYGTAKDYLLSENDILLARSGGTVGKSFYFSGGIKACFAGYLIKLRSDITKCVPNFMYLFLNSNSYWEQITSGQIKATIQNVSGEKYSNFDLALPPIDEQIQIEKMVNKKLYQFDSLINNIQNSNTLLAEKKQSLISHAVTGKIKVI